MMARCGLSAAAEVAGSGEAACACVEGGGGGGEAGGPEATRWASFGPRQMRIRWRDSRRSTSDRSCSFINSTNRRIRSISKTVGWDDSLSLIGYFRILLLGGGGAFAGRGRGLSAIAGADCRIRIAEWPD